MNKQVIFNLAVSDLDRSKAFFASLGFHFKPQYSSDNTAYMVVVDDCIHAMLMTEAFFASLGHPSCSTQNRLVQASQANEVIICLSCESREELASLIDRARSAGARIPHPLEDHGFMVDQGFEDLDGHLWNLVWMAPQP